MKTTGSKKQMRSLNPGESIPCGVPRRYCYGKYVNLRWKVGTNQYVEVREHRVKNGKVISGIAHHINHDKSDNRPENIQIVKTTAEHLKLHRRIDRETAAKLYRSGLSTIQVAKSLKTHCGNISNILQEEGVERRYGKGKRPHNFKLINESEIIESLKRNHWNVLAVERQTGLGRMIIRRVQKDHKLPRISGKPITKTIEQCRICGRMELLKCHGRCNACQTWLEQKGTDRPKDKPFRKRTGKLASKALALLEAWNNQQAEL